MAGTDLTEIQSGQQVRISGQDSTGVPTNPVGATTNGLMVDVQASVLPTGAATSTAQAAEQVLIGPVTETAPATDTASSGLNGRLQRIAQRITSLIALLPSTISIPWFERITDGTNTAAVKAASTAAVAADPALVVAISPNNTIPENLTQVGGSAITLGQKTMAASLPVVLPSDQTITTTASPLPTTGSKFSFGGVTTASAAQVAVNATAYTEVTTNAAMTIVSSSANDSSAGTGARTVTVTYYDQNMTGPQTVTITMNGTTAVTSPNNNMAFIEKIVVATVGSGGSNAGTLTLKSGATTVATIPAGQNLTAFAHHYVPQGKTCYISGFCVGANGSSAGQSAAFVLKASTPTVANTPEVQVSDFLQVTGAGNSVIRTYNSPIQVIGPARVQAYVTPGATSSYTSYAAFDYIDN